MSELGVFRIIGACLAAADPRFLDHSALLRTHLTVS